MNDEKKLMRQLQVFSFALYEAALYLDAHPNDKRALEYYAAHQRKLSELKARYERQYGPLTYNSYAGGAWKWSRGPWPWEYSDERGGV